MTQVVVNAPRNCQRVVPSDALGRLDARHLQHPLKP